MMGFSELVVASVRGVAGADMLRGPDGKTHFARVHATNRRTGRLVVAVTQVPVGLTYKC